MTIIVTNYTIKTESVIDIEAEFHNAFYEEFKRNVLADLEDMIRLELYRAFTYGDSVVAVIDPTKPKRKLIR